MSEGATDKYVKGDAQIKMLIKTHQGTIFKSAENLTLDMVVQLMVCT